MAIAHGNRVEFAYVIESVVGTAPVTPTMKVLRLTNPRRMQLDKNILQSEEVRSDRQIADSRHGFNSVTGQLGFEFSLESYDDMLEGIMGGTWTAVDSGATSVIDIINTAGGITLGAGSFITKGYRVGDMVTLSGFSNGVNNGTFRVTAVAAGTMTVDATTVVEADGLIAYPGKRLDVGTTLRTYTFEQRFLNITKYRPFHGVTANQMTIDIQPERIVGGQIDVLGMSDSAMAGTSIAGSVTAAGTTSPLSAFDGHLYEGTTATGLVAGVNIQINNNRSLSPILFSKYSPDVFEGDCEVGGTLSAFFQDEVIYNKFRAETPTSVWLKLNELASSRFMSIVMPRVKYNGEGNDPPRRGPVAFNMPFQALVDSTSLTSISFQRSYA
jgi:hypothetical protein